jgi:tRNA A-37 threonylcarbamoyl transferase component Bud32
MEQVTGVSSWDYFCHNTESSNEEQQQTADNILFLLARLQQYHIVHGDLKGSNLLLHQQQAILLDLDAMQQYKNSKRFLQKWQKDKKRFLQNWLKKECYHTWSNYFSERL